MLKIREILAQIEKGIDDDRQDKQVDTAKTNLLGY